MIRFTTKDAKPEKPRVEVGAERQGKGVLVYAQNPSGVMARILYLHQDGSATLCVNGKELTELGFQVDEAGEIVHV